MSDARLRGNWGFTGEFLTQHVITPVQVGHGQLARWHFHHLQRLHTHQCLIEAHGAGEVVGGERAAHLRLQPARLRGGDVRFVHASYTGDRVVTDEPLATAQAMANAAQNAVTQQQATDSLREALTTRCVMALTTAAIRMPK